MRNVYKHRGRSGWGLGGATYTPSALYNPSPLLRSISVSSFGILAVVVLF